MCSRPMYGVSGSNDSRVDGLPYLRYRSPSSSSQPLGTAIDDTRVLVAGEAEADEPLAVELPRRLLQQRHPPPVVLDQVVVGGEDVGDAR